MKNLTIKLTILFVYAFFAVNVSFAQGSIEGYISDELSNMKIEFAAISLENKHNFYQTQSNYEGYYKIDNIKSGKYIMTVFFQGKKQTLEEITVNNDLQNLSIAGNFTTVIGNDDDFTVIVYKNLFRVDKPDVEVIDAETFKNAPIRTISKAVSTTSSVVETPKGLSIKGARPGTAVYYIDGIRTYGELNISMSAIKEIEVYSGAIPAKYGNSTSGVITIETKGYFDY